MTRETEYTLWKPSYDVLIAGGGTTGCCAALAAARQGATVALIEKLPFLGGNMSAGLPWLGFHHPVTHEIVVKGLPVEIIERLRQSGGATEFIMDPIAGSAVAVNGPKLKMLLASMLQEAGVDTILHSIVTDVEVQNGNVGGFFIHNKQGCQFIEARTFIDCTDSADACSLAGAECILGRVPDHKRQVASYVMFFGDIDFGEMLLYFDRHPDQIRPFPLSTEQQKKLLIQMKHSPLFIMGGFQNIIKKAKSEKIDYKRDQLVGVAFPPHNELMLVSSRVENVDPNDVKNHSLSELEGLRQYESIEKLLHDYIPGCSKARIVSCGTQLGLRETRHVVGEWLLTAEDLMSGRAFEDSIAKGAYHLDIHSPDHTGLETRQPPVYQIPYRSLVVNGLNNMFVAGRGISATHEAMSSTRITPVASATGEAAGVAAAFCAYNHISTREVDVGSIQNILKNSNCLL